MYHKKKLAVFISHIYGNYQEKLITGICNRAYSLGYPLEIYSTNDGEDLGSYGIGEESFLRIPNFNDIEGIIFASGTYSDSELKEKVLNTIKNSGCPVIEVAESNPSFTHVTMENNTTAGDLTKHMYEVHGAKRICYLGHINNRFYSDKREDAYKLALNELSVTPSEADIFLCDETDSSYVEAINHFKSTGSFDAVICYNDRVAMGLLEQAKILGYNIPKDFAITGCDNLESGKFITPSLTSVSFPLEEVGTKAVDSLISLINNGTTDNICVKAQPIYNESCGCKTVSATETFEYFTKLNKKISELEKSMLVSMKMSAALSHATDIDDGVDIIEQYVNRLENINEFYLCLYSNWDSIADPILDLAFSKDEYEATDDNSMIMKLGIKNGKRIPECSYAKASLLPAFVSADSNLSFVVTPLFFEERAFGYVAMSFKNGKVSFKFELVQWIMNIAQFLQNTCEVKRSGLLSKHLEEIYLKDSLTGLLNRHGFNNLSEKPLPLTKYKTMMVFDLDKLKMINDTYGHEEGDFALKTIGQAIQRAKETDDICARFGGDEFYCLLCHDNESYPDSFISKVEKFINNYNSLSNKPYNISSSSGYSTVSESHPDLDELFKIADSNMYENKKKKQCR